VQQSLNVHPTIEIDASVPQKNESKRHWAIKAGIVGLFRSHPDCSGAVETEKKTSDLIADVRCELEESPPDIPDQFVVEVQTAASNKDLHRATENHLRHGYAVYWVYDIEALDQREKAEETLAEQMASIPDFGVASLTEGELTLGAPITWDDFESNPPWLGQTELYVPTYQRSSKWYDHGRFLVEGEEMTIYRVAGSSDYFISQMYPDGQQTLPRRSVWSPQELYEGIQEGEIRRLSPVRGPP
jgi:hypothetical protein